MNKRVIGTEKEQIAEYYLVNKGYRILARNFRIRTGEIDLIAEYAGTIVFLEVKFRNGRRNGSPLEAVTGKKQQVIVWTARYFLYRYGYCETTPCRFDVIGIEGNRITHIENAFDAF